MVPLRLLWRPIAFAALFLAAVHGTFAQGTGHLLIDYVPETGATYLNPEVGADIFYAAGYLGANTIVANVEAGHIWYDHDAFNRPATVTTPVFTFTNTTSLNEVDFHATMVGNALAGTGYDSVSDQYFYSGLGIAPYAGVWSGAIATEFSATNLGAFSTTTTSTLTTYKAFFNGINGEKPDVINSSWGGTDPAGNSPETVAIDGLARQNPTVTFVVSAGNGGAETVGGPGSGYNNITVGSVGGPTRLDPSSFSSRGPADFYNPETGQTVTGVRAAVDIAAPGERLVLAAYLGDSGSIGASTDPDIQALVQASPLTDQYFLSMDGTSFSAPIVAGGVALLKDVAKSPFYSADLGAEALDSRVIKSVLMASAQETTGWDNGQILMSGVIVTEQALDYTTGAGALDLDAAAGVFVGGTTDVAGLSGGEILSVGWDMAQIGTANPGTSQEYLFQSSFDSETDLTVSLNWFAGRSFDDSADLTLDGSPGEELSFANLNLQIWQYTGVDSILVAESVSLYNNTEFLRVSLTTPGFYSINVVYDGMIYDVTPGGVTSETYGLAWKSVTVPEPNSTLLVMLAVALLSGERRRRYSAA